MRYGILLWLAALSFHCSNTENGEAAETTAAALSDAESPAIEVTIQGTTPGQAYLIGFQEDRQLRADSAMVDAGGKVVFQRAAPYDPGLYYLLLPNRSTLQLLIDTDQTFALSTQAGDPVQQMQVSGSRENDLLYQNLKFEAGYASRYQAISRQLQNLDPGRPAYTELQAQREQLVAERQAHLQEIFDAYPDAFFTSFKRAGQNPAARDVRRPDGSVDKPRQIYLFRSEYWDGVDFTDERLLRTPVIINKLKQYITEMTAQHPDSLIAATDMLMQKVPDGSPYYRFFANWIPLQYEPGNTTMMDGEAILVHMVDHYLTDERAFWAEPAQLQGLRQRAGEMRASLLGKQGPDVEAPDPNGTLRAISDIDAPYVVVFMYNPECDHCIEETPRLVQFYRQWKNRGVEVYAIAIDTDEVKWKDFIARNNMNWINVHDPTNRSFYGKYYVDNTPEIYVLNPQRTIIGKNLKVSQIAEVIEMDRRES